MDPIILGSNRRTGWIEVVCGSMFSGKTEELIRRLKRARIARQRVEIYKPAIDARYSDSEVVSHDDNVIPSIPIDAADQIILLAEQADVIGIDEAQFFGVELVDVCCELAARGKRVIVAGLDQDYLGKPFDPIPQLMAVAEYATKLHAICVVCGSPANHSQRIVNTPDRVLVGASESYEPRCRNCFRPNETSPHPDFSIDSSFVSAKNQSQATTSEPAGPSPTPNNSERSDTSSEKHSASTESA